MNSIFFFIPFLIVASLGIYQDSFAVESYRGENYLDITNPDGSHSRTIGIDRYVYDGNNYVPFIFTDGSSKQVKTGHGNVRLNTNGSLSFYENGITDTIIAKYADISNLNSWTYPNNLNNAVPTISWNGSALISSKTKSGVGLLEYKYVTINGVWKTQLEATNLSGLTTKVFGFDQIIDLSTDTVQFGKTVRNLDNYNNTTLDKTWLDNNKSKVVNFMNNINFNFDLGYDNLYSITIIDTGVNSSRLIFDYRTNSVLLPNQKLIIDPTYSNSAPTLDGFVEDSSGNNICDTSDGTKYATTALEINRYSLVSAGECDLTFVEFDISTIPTNVTILDSDFDFDVQTTTGGGINCDVVSLGTTQPSNGGTTAQNIFDAILVGTQLLTNDATCATVGNSKTVDLGATGDAQIQARVTAGSGFFSFGIKPNNLTLNATTYGEQLADQSDGTATPKPTLTITYSGNPDAVSNITLQNRGFTNVNFNWTQPTLGGSLVNYIVNYTSPFGSPVTFLANTTNTYYNATGLITNTDYSFGVTPQTNYGYNSSSYILNVTTASMANYTASPTLSRVFPNATTSTSVLNLEWTNNTIDNIKGYRIDREVPVGNGFSIIITNTSNALLYYNNSGLSVNNYYNYKIYALNATGMSAASNSYSMTTFHLPDSVTTLSVTMSDALTALLTWVQPTILYGYLSGYQINYTTPLGDPLTVYVADTGSSTVTYTVGGLSSDPYSFRVSAITTHGKNTTSAAITNGTASSNFEIGSVFLPTGTNPDTIPIVFTHHTINSTSTNVKVTYDSSYDLACDFRYPISQTNHTYSGLTENAISGSSVYSNFTLNGYGNAVTDIYCWNQLNNSTNGKDRIGTTTIPLIGQINSFQTGAFGTSGGFGALDFMTLIIVIISMIGFNRTHPIVGVAFMTVFIGAMTYYHAIAEQTTYLGAVALVIALAIIYGRRDDAE